MQRILLPSASSSFDHYAHYWHSHKKKYESQHFQCFSNSRLPGASILNIGMVLVVRPSVNEGIRALNQFNGGSLIILIFIALLLSYTYFCENPLIKDNIDLNCQSFQLVYLSCKTPGDQRPLFSSQSWARWKVEIGEQTQPKLLPTGKLSYYKATNPAIGVIYFYV